MVINCMAIVKWPGILKGTQHLLLPLLLSTRSHFAHFMGSFWPARCHHSHDVVGLHHAPEKVGSAILCPRDGIPLQANILIAISMSLLLYNHKLSCSIELKVREGGACEIYHLIHKHLPQVTFPHLTVIRSVTH